MQQPPPMHRIPYGHQELEFMVGPWFDVETADGRSAPREYDVVVVGVGAPHDADLRRALDAVVSVCSAASPLVRQGGAIVMAAQLSEGAGDLPAEASVSSDVARVLERCLVVVAASEAPEVVRLAKLRASVDVEEALEIAYEHIGRPQRASLLIVPRALHTLPVVTTTAGGPRGRSPRVG